MNRLFTFFIISLCITTLSASAQSLAVKTNLLYGGITLTPNLGLEIGLGQKTSLDIGVGYNPWNLKGTIDNNKKLVHLIGEAEFRYWISERFNGHFFGVHGLYSQYNISQRKLPMLFGSDSDKYRFEGDAIGGGVSYGYQWMIGKRWNVEATLGVGVAYLNYDKFDCAKCGEKTESSDKIYFGPTKAAISVIYIIK